MIQGYHVFEDLCTDPDYDEELKCVCEPGNLSNPYAVAVKKEISGDTCSRSISPICSVSHSYASCYCLWNLETSLLAFV